MKSTGEKSSGPGYSARIVDAVGLAYELHARQVRKGGETPYITHLFGVAALVGEHGGDEDQFIAALLHDAAEDQGGPAVLARIRERFGDRVAALVAGATDSQEEPKPPWRGRKEAHLARIHGAAPELRLVLASDKLYNVRSICRDLRQSGAATWGKFNGKRDGTLWYYGAMLDALSRGWDHPILAELREAHARLVEMAGENGGQ